MTTTDPTPTYLDPDQPTDARARDLVSRMTLDEKVSQMTNNSPAVMRLGIPAYNWWSECLHGVARAGKATVFPQAIGLAATFDTELIGKVAEVISDEARAKHHAAVRAGDRGQYRGLTFWSPNVNLFRDPRWGRGQETYGEDPFLSGQIGTAFVKGLQGDDPTYLKIAACAKHFAVHSGPEGDRHHFNAKAGPKDLYETYLPAFKALVDAGVESVMGAYNRTNGEPCCASRLLLQDILRGKWGFDGHVVSDCGAIADIHKHHHVTDTPAHAAALAVQRGCDLNCGCAYSFLAEAVEKGLLTEDDLDRSLLRLMKTRMKLGMFDPEERVPYARIPMKVVNCARHRRLARKAAAESIVLLRNRDGLLPLDADRTGRVFVTGPHAASINAQLGNYYGMSSRIVTFLEGIVDRLAENGSMEYRPGCLTDRPNPNPIDWATGEASASDAIVAVCGLDLTMEGEEGEAIASGDIGDRFDIRLPQNQVDYLRKLKETGKPVIAVLTGGSPIIFPEDLADAILFAWYPGEEGGHALADVLFGATAPAGRLPVTFPRSLNDLPSYADYAMDGRTYRFAHTEPLYPFGFGLGYAAFTYEKLRLSAGTIEAGQSIEATVTMRNTGDTPADEVVQVYLTDAEASVRVPHYALVGFRRVRVQPGKARRVPFVIDAEAMTGVGEDGEPRYEPGRFRVTAGGACPSPRSTALGAAEPVTAEFVIGQ